MFFFFFLGFRVSRVLNFQGLLVLGFRVFRV